MPLNEASVSDRRYRIAIIYDTMVRPDTTGEYCRRALEGLGHLVSHYLPQDAALIPPIYDLYLRVDDDGEAALPEALRPLALWAIDTHRHYARRLEWAKQANVVFCAQRNGAQQMEMDGVAAHWLPLACDPDRHHHIAGTTKTYDVCFIGNCFPEDGERSRLLALLQSRYPRMFVGRAYGEEMTRLYNAARIVFNCAIRDDVNMRVFEATACGSLLVTNDLRENGQNLLFTPGKHLVTFADGSELIRAIDHYLADEDERERIAEAGMRHAIESHTYRDRMRELVAVAMHAPQGTQSLEGLVRASEGATAATSYPAVAISTQTVRAQQSVSCSNDAARPRASIIIPVYNRLDMTQQCVSALRRFTDLPYEIIIVDNGSSDGSGEWAQREGLRVLLNEENRGFPIACNQGIRAAELSEYLVLLNNDVIVSPGWLGRLIAHAVADPGVGMVGPSANFACSRQQIAVQYTSMDEFIAFAEQVAHTGHGQATEVVRLIGLCLLIPRPVVQQVGLLDERFGIGLFEDDDYSLRVRIAGYRLLWARDVFVHHAGHQTFQTMPDSEYRTRMIENQRRFLDKWNVQPYLSDWRDEVRIVTGVSPALPGPWDLLQACRFAEAYDAFEAHLQRHPEDLHALYGLGLSAENRGVPQAARLAYEGILARHPNHSDAHRGLSRVASDANSVIGKNGNCRAHALNGSSAVSGYHDHERPEVAALVPLSARRILDVGCGSGRLGASLKAVLPRHVVGIELNAAAAAEARARLDEVLVGDVEQIDLPFAAYSFDCVICADVLEHLRDPWTFLARVRGLLSPEGSLVLSLPNVQFIQVLHDAACGRWTYMPAGILDRTHLRFFTRQEMGRLLQTAGFCDERWQPVIPQDLAKNARHVVGKRFDLVTDRIRINSVASEELEGYLAVQFLIVARPNARPADALPSVNGTFTLSIVPSQKLDVPLIQEIALPPLELLQQGRYADAYDAFERVLREDPEDVNAMLGLGFAAEGRGATAAAAMAYRLVLEKRPDDPEVRRALERIRRPAEEFLAANARPDEACPTLAQGA